jgi:hypothetical protein
MGTVSIVKLPAIRLHFVALNNETDLANGTLAEEGNFRNQHDKTNSRTVGSTKIQDRAIMSRKNRHCEHFPIGSIAMIA